MTRIYVDGDACPVKAEIIKVVTRYQLPTFVVSNQGLRAAMGPLITGILVGSEFDAADNWIVEHIAAGDIAITADIQLAGRCVKKAAHAIGPTGQLFTSENIGTALAMRELNAYLREAGTIKGINPAFSKKDSSNFLQAFDRLLQQIIRLSGG